MSRSNVSYPKEMRDRAKADGKTLATVDANVDGYRHTLQGPFKKPQQQFLVWASIAACKLSPRQLDDYRRDMKKKLERKMKREASDE